MATQKVAGSSNQTSTIYSKTTGAPATVFGGTNYDPSLWSASAPAATPPAAPPATSPTTSPATSPATTPTPGQAPTIPTAQTVGQTAADLIAQRRQQSQESIDLLNQSYASQVAAQQELGKENVAAQNAQMAAAGLMGGNIAGSAIAGTKQKELTQENLIKGQQAQQIAGILMDINKQANQDAMTLSQQTYDEQIVAQQTAQQNFQTVAKVSNLSWDQLSQLDPTTAQNFLTTTGMDAAQAALMWNGQKALAQQIQWQAPVQTSDGMMFYGINPATGGISTLTIPGDMKGWDIKLTNDGTAIRTNAQGTLEQYLGNGMWGTTIKDNFGKVQYLKTTDENGNTVYVDPVTGNVVNAPGTGTVNIPAGTLAAQNNNPGNIKYVGQANATEGAEGFAKFDTPEEGYQALKDLIDTYKSQNVTCNDFVAKYAPSTENDTQTYISQFCQSLGVKPTDNLNSLDTESIAQFMAKKESGTTINQPTTVPTIASGATNEDITKALTTGAPLNLKGVKYDQGTLYNAAIADMLGAPTGVLGGMGAAAGRAAMGNKENQIMQAYGLTPIDVSAAKAEYKGLTAANTKLISQAAFIKTYTATAKDNLDLALAQSANVPRTGAKMVNKYALWAQGQYTPAGPLATFETYIYTASREYAKVTSGGAMSAQGLTDSAQREASNLLNAAQSPEAFAAAVSAMKQDMDNVNVEFNKSIGDFAPNVGKLLGISGTADQSGNSYDNYLKTLQ